MTVAERELTELYGRYKSLALSAAAAAILEQPLDVVIREADRLLDDCRAALREPGIRSEQLGACVDAASVLRAALGESGADLEGVRASHRALRRSVWDVLPCEYVPCCANDHHIHRS